MADHCIFCKIIKKEIPSTPVYEDDLVYAFPDIKPAAPVHILIIPKVHVDSVSDIPDPDPIAAVLINRANLIAKKLGVADSGFRLVFNHGDNGGQTVYHLHLHLLGGRFMTWPPG